MKNIILTVLWIVNAYKIYVILDQKKVFYQPPRYSFPAESRPGLGKAPSVHEA